MPLQRPDQMRVTDDTFNKVVSNLISMYAVNFTTSSLVQHYICPLNEINANLLAKAMPAYFRQFASYVGSDPDWALSKADLANLTSPDNWVAVYDPAVISTQAVIPREGCLSGHDAFKKHNRDFENEPFCVQSDWLVRYVGDALQIREYPPVSPFI